jgi:hypothetical protein
VAISAKAEFIRGPYDGLILDVEQVERFVGDDAMRESFDDRLFLLMPRPLDWNRVVQGGMGKDGPFDLTSPYQVTARPEGLKLVFHGIAHFRRAPEDPV